MNGLRDRFKSASWFDQVKDVLVGGCGGIGSWFTFFATRAGFSVYVFDNDVIETHNLGGQLFTTNDIGTSKTKAVQNICNLYSDNRITIINELYTEKSDANPIMIGAFDNMEARKVFYNNWKKQVLKADSSMKFQYLLIDGRLEAETWQIYCVTPETMELYEEEGLFDESEVKTKALCTLKQTSHMAAMIGSVMLGFLTNYLSNIKLGMKIRKVPFFTEFGMANSYYKSKS